MKSKQNNWAERGPKMRENSTLCKKGSRKSDFFSKINFKSDIISHWRNIEKGKKRLKTHFNKIKIEFLEIHLESTASKSSTRSLVSSVPLRDPTAQTNLVALARIRHTTPPLPPLSNATRSRINSPAKIKISLIVLQLMIW